MINNIIKFDLDQLKNKIKREINANYEQSYNDVISFLVKNYYNKPKRIVYPIDQKLLVGIPLKPVSTVSVSTLLDKKTRVSYSLSS